MVQDLYSYSAVPFMEHGRSLTCSQKPVTGFYHKSSSPDTQFVNISFNTILPFAPRSPKWSLLWCFRPIFLSISPVHHTCYMPSPSHSGWKET